MRLSVLLAGMWVLPATARGQDPLPLSAFGYDQGAPLDARLSARAAPDSLTEFDVSFLSPKGGRATGILVVPPGGRVFPAVIVLHGSSGNARQVLSRAEFLARHGMIGLAMDAPSARRGGQWIHLTVQDSAEQVQLIVDLQRAVDFLLTRSDVDPRRLAFHGYSYGAAMGGLFAAVERRLKAYVLAVGDGGLVSHFTGTDDEHGPLSQLPPDDRDRWLSAMRPIEPMRFIHRAPPAVILFQSARFDQLVPPPDAEALHAAAREPKTVQWYDTGHGLPRAAEEAMVTWLKATL